jgi:orotate phosphoribosyltransferase
MLAAQDTRYCVVGTESAPQVDVNRDLSEARLLSILKEKSVCEGSFTLASGAHSDLYVDAKLTTLDPHGAHLVGEVGWRLVQKTAERLGVRVDAIGGLTMGADPIALSIGIAAFNHNPSANLQTFTVRKTPKSHGRLKLIEGNFSPGDSVVVVDDVITTGGSTLKAIEAVEASGGKVAFVLVLVDRQEGGRQTIEKCGHKVVAIFTREDVVTNASRRARIATT